MGKGIFITATGTDVGKTFLSSLIVKKLARAGISIGYYKAALSGAELRGGQWIAGDADYVYRSASLEGNPNDAVSYIFAPAVSPHLAAQIDDVEIEIGKIAKDFKKKLDQHDFLLMEGSGGIICPISIQKGNRIFLTDIIKLLGLSIVIVSDAGLGTINSTMLTVHFVKTQNIRIQAIILNRYDSHNIVHRDNKNMIALMSQVPVYTCAEHCTDLALPLDKIQGFFQDIDQK